MTLDAITDERVVADVKCYHCGHISGQIFGRKHQPLSVRNFVPRVGYAGPPVRPGMKLRCERCGGPVFLEDATNGLPPARKAARRSPAQQTRAAAPRALTAR
jgi:hypothetical protein